MRPDPRPIVIASILASSTTALAQEATNTPAATQPAVGHFYLRQRFQYLSMSDDPARPPEQDREIDQFLSLTALSYGLAPKLSATIEAPITYQSIDAQAPASDDDDEFGFEDLSLSLKWRPFQIDLNPVDSIRFAAFGGVEFPTGTGDLSSHSFDPFIGGVFTTIIGRHGFNQALTYKFNTGGDEFPTRPGDGPDDALRYDSAYLFRIDPAEYSGQTTAATYLTLELNGLYETGGDNEIILAPGILYEASSFALEATFGFPISQHVSERPETDFILTLGFRLLF